MMILSRQSLMAFVWASAALATPFSHSMDPIFNSDLEVRQEANMTCPDSYTSENGLEFTTYCEQNNPFNADAQPAAFQTDSMQDCMEYCSRYRGNGEGCFGVVWTNVAGHCWLRNSTTSTANLEPNTGCYSALIKNDGMKPLDTACPNTDLSDNSLPGVEGIRYRTYCGKVIGSEYNMPSGSCFSGIPKPCWNAPYQGFFHAKTLEECLKICVDQHPLCMAVSWNPDLSTGFANCFPKTGYVNYLSDPSAKLGIIHSAAITTVETPDTECPSDNTYTAAQGKTSFDIHCGKANTGANITIIHSQNVTACMDACAASDQKCVGVLFDSTLAGGYNNCCLQNTTSVIVDQASVTYAVLSTQPLASSSTSPSASPGTSPSSSPPSKAWIAGPVIGGIVAFLALSFAIFWWRNRKASKAVGIEKDGRPLAHTTGHGLAPSYSPDGHAGDAQQQKYYNNVPTELETEHMSELPTNTTKYAHTATGTVPQELPA
ncbi:hypothetical protein EJ02DRAFT_335402 [Clathrospora elynae]|uniref:Apple domain-containing protein n=1 Tax=Clathrospora elynae TaxID=706981 RepID=A0A6A5T801_9PLEO|nr:hypothetical protein EJ02DRAFT_335402 [Clathrospora elynae]